MDRRIGNIAIAFACGAIVAAWTLFLSCGPSNPASSAPAVSTTPLKDLIITSQIAGWQINTNYSDTAQNFTDATSNLFVDGGNSDYCDACNGNDRLKGGIATYFIDTQNNYKLMAFVLDYGTASAAKAEFNIWVNKNDGLALPKETISSFANTTAIGYEEGGGLYVYAHFINYYVELQFSNYNPSSLANPDAAAFLSYFNSKIK